MKQYCDVKYSKTECPILLEGYYNVIADYFWNNYFYYFKSDYETYIVTVYQALQQLRETLAWKPPGTGPHPKYLVDIENAFELHLKKPTGSSQYTLTSEENFPSKQLSNFITQLKIATSTLFNTNINELFNFDKLEAILKSLPVISDSEQKFYLQIAILCALDKNGYNVVLLSLNNPHYSQLKQIVCESFPPFTVSKTLTPEDIQRFCGYPYSVQTPPSSSPTKRNSIIPGFFT